MINFDSLTLKALIRELEPVFVTGRVQKIQQPSKNELLISIRSPGKNHKFYLNIDPKYPHAAFIANEENRNIEIPQVPPMFCMLLRKHMEGAKISEIRQPNYERILELYFDSYNEVGARIPLVLAIELMGKYSNIILYNYDTNVILGSAHTVSSEKSREREIAGGLPYIYPPKPDKIDLLQISFSEFFELAKAIPGTLNNWLNNSFYYISLALATEFCHVTGIDTEKGKIIATPKEKIQQLYNLAYKTLNLENLNPAISKDKRLFSLIGRDPEIKWQKIASVNFLVDEYFGFQMSADHFARLKTSLTTQVNKELKMQKIKLNHYAKAADATEKAERYRQFADLIMANLYRIKSGESCALLENFFENNTPVEIKLDPSFSASANAQKYYKLYNKAKNAAIIGKDLLKKIMDDINYVESVKIAIDLAASLYDLRQIQEELEGQNIIKAQKQIKASSKNKKSCVELTQYNSSDNYKIYVGRNNSQNDYLVSKIASADDIWLHVQNIPGSHVLIKSDRKEIPEETILEAAQLAAYYSQARESGNVAVIYTKRKYLKKPPCAKPGYVTYSNEKTLFVNPKQIVI